MYRHLIIAAAMLVPTAVAAQQAPEAAQRDLWCGLAFNLVAGDVTADAPGRQQAVIPFYAEGAEMLLERAAAAYRSGGFSERAFVARREALAAEVAALLAGSGPPPYSFEECSALLGPATGATGRD